MIEGPLKMAVDARMAAEPHAITYIDFLTVTLTALCALLTLLAIILAVAAVWGYVGLRDEITKAVTERAQRDLAAKLSEYPDSKDIVELFTEMQALHARQKRLGDLLVTGSAAKTVADTSKSRQTGAKSETLAKKYPGKGT